jgi:GTP-binding protein EngB required for normal cell division
MKSIIICGDAGVGKSSFINQVIGKNIAKVGEDVAGVTKDLSFCSGNLKGCPITLVDMPGFGDQDVNIAQLQAMWEKNLKSKRFNFLFYLVSGEEKRLNTNTLMMFKIINIVTEIQDNENFIVLVRTKCDNLPFKKSDYETNTMAYIGLLNKKLKEKNMSITKIKNYILTSTNHTSGIDKIYELIQTQKEFLFPVVPVTEKKIKNAAQIISETSGIPIVINQTVNYNNSKNYSNNSSTTETKYEYSSSCYHPNSIVVRKEKDNINEIFMKDLRIGDYVLSSKGTFEKVLTFSEYKGVETKIVKLVLKNIVDNSEKKEILLTEPHYVLTQRNGIRKKIPSRLVSVGDLLTGSKGSQFEVEKVLISEYFGDLVNARTSSSTIVVNEINCLCDAENDAGYLGHLLLVIADKMHENLPNYISRFGIKMRKIIGI